MAAHSGAIRPPLVLVLGGARSGKSVFAEALAEGHDGPLLYVATAEAGDDEMAARIAAHRARRGPRWRAVEAPHDLPGALSGISGVGAALVDCLTLWLSNLLLGDADLEAAGARLIAALDDRTVPIILVANEVGLGIVPDNALARRFRDAAGRLNQRVAAAADSVHFMAAGLPLTLKPAAGGQPRCA